ncbi:MAG: hypothetical protein ACRDBY_01970 [Cetobacterium sp.]
MKNTILYACSKTFSKIEYAQDFLKGILRFMPLNYYTNLEGDSREDKYEGVSSFLQPHLSKFVINGMELNPKELVGPILIRSDLDKAHIFCMSAFYFQSSKLIVETEEEIWENFYKPCKEKLLTFGDITVFITNIKEFFKRVDNAIKANELIYKRNLVEYRTLNDFHGEVKDPGFIKDLRYRNENEYRISLKELSDEPFFLNIGDISDIAWIFDTKDIDKCSFEFKE